MKKIILIAVVALAVSSACRKTLTCECTDITTSTPNGGAAIVVTNPAVKVTKDKQKTKEFRQETDCYTYTSTQTFTNGTVVTDHKCELKK